MEHSIPSEMAIRQPFSEGMHGALALGYPGFERRDQ